MTLTLTSHDAVALRDDSHAAQHALALHVGTFDDSTGNDGIVVRPDLAFVIVYASTATHMLESRANGRGAYRHRINREIFSSAADIPASYRKLGAIARAVESADVLTLAALDTRYRADLALQARNEYNDEATRADAVALLESPSPFTN